MNQKYDYDYFVIGAGSGGVRSARIAASHGAKVGIAEEKYFGGTCVNVGCVPKKLMSYASHFSDDFTDSKGYGWTLDNTPHFDWNTLIQNKDKELARLNGIYNSLLENSNIDIYKHKAHFIDNHTIKVGDEIITADKILIAVGGKPRLPDEPGAKEFGITSDELFYLKEHPKKTLVVGGGYIALEFASILKGLGSDVTLLYRGDLFLRGFDNDLRHKLKDCMSDRGIHLIFNETIASLEKNNDEITTYYKNAQTSDVFNTVFYAIGRTPNTETLGLDNTDVEMNEKGGILVDDKFKTGADNIYALGDVINRIELTPVAIQEGHFLADYLFSGKGFEMSYDMVASAVFTTPPIGTVGLNEQDALEQGHHLDIYESSFRPMKNILAGRDEKTYMKLIVDQKNNRVLGCHMIGPDSPEIIQMAAIALKMNATKHDFDNAMAVHPTAAEEFVTMRSISRQEKP